MENKCNCKEKCECKKKYKCIVFGIGYICLLILAFTLGRVLFLEPETNENNKDDFTISLYNAEAEGYVDISLKNDKDIEEFLTLNFTKELSDILSDESIDEFKVAYVIKKMELFSDLVDVKYMEIDFLNNEIEKVFKDGIDLEYFSSILSLNLEEYIMTCDVALCSVYYAPGGGAGYSYIIGNYL